MGRKKKKKYFCLERKIASYQKGTFLTEKFSRGFSDLSNMINKIIGNLFSIHTTNNKCINNTFYKGGKRTRLIYEMFIQKKTTLKRVFMKKKII